MNNALLIIYLENLTQELHKVFNQLQSDTRSLAIELDGDETQLLGSIMLESGVEEGETKGVFSWPHLTPLADVIDTLQNNILELKG